MPTELKIERIRNGFTQRDVAERLGVKQATVSAWEHGLSVPRPHTMQEIEDLYGVPKDQLFFAVFNKSNLLKGKNKDKK